MSTIKSFPTKTTTLKTMLEHFNNVPKGELESVVRFLTKQLGLTHITGLGNLDWDGDILSLVSLSNDAKKDGVKVRLASVIHCLKTVKKFHRLQGNEGTLYLPSTFYKLKMMLPHIDKGMKNMTALNEVKFPRPISHKNWLFLKRDINEILRVHSLEWTLWEYSSLSPILSTGVCIWFRKNVGTSKYEFLVRGSTSKEVWETLGSWFDTSKLTSGRKSYLRSQLNDAKLDSVGSIEDFVNKYYLFLEELKEINGADSQNELVDTIRKGALSSNLMQSNASRIEDAGVQTVEHITKAFSRIYVNVHGLKVFMNDKPRDNKQKVRRVETGKPEPKVHSNYSNKRDYEKLRNKLNEKELKNFHKTRNFTKKIKKVKLK